jgi:hypothetical protein
MERSFTLLLFLTCTVVVRASGQMARDIRAGSPMDYDAEDPTGANLIVNGKFSNLAGAKLNGRFNIHGMELVADKFRDVAQLRIASTFGPNKGLCFGSALGGFFGAMAQSVECNGNDVIQTITERCTPSGGSIVVRWINFMHCRGEGNGGAIFIGSQSLMSICSCSFLDCCAESYDGGCAYLLDVNSGSSVIDSCATKCEGYKGSCVYFDSQVSTSQ